MSLVRSLKSSNVYGEGRVTRITEISASTPLKNPGYTALSPRLGPFVSLSSLSSPADTYIHIYSYVCISIYICVVSGVAKVAAAFFVQVCSLPSSIAPFWRCCHKGSSYAICQTYTASDQTFSLIWIVTATLDIFISAEKFLLTNSNHNELWHFPSYNVFPFSTKIIYRYVRSFIFIHCDKRDVYIIYYRLKYCDFRVPFSLYIIFKKCLFPVFFKIIFYNIFLSLLFSYIYMDIRMYI